MAAHKLSEAGATEIRKVIDEVTSDPLTKLPGFVFTAVNKNGEELISYASGKIGVDTNEPMQLDTVFWIASCTKLITCIACMQLVEQGKLNLDDADQAEALCPQLKAAKVFKGFENNKPILVPKKTGITLRMLLTHTAGFGYSFFNPAVRRCGYPVGFDEFSGRYEDLYNQPLMFEPGTALEYGVNIDWAGILVEKASGLSLDAYYQKYIFAPLDMKSITFFPTEEQKSRLVHMSQRGPDGTITAREHIMRLYLVAKPEEREGIFKSGGGGCYGEPKEYTRLLSMLLNNGTSPITGAQVLKPESVDQIFTNQVPQWPDCGRQPIITGRPEYANSVTELYPQPHDLPQGYGLTVFLTLHEGETGRGKSTGFWAGMPNLFWWVDRERGVAGIAAGQVVPFGDAHVVGTWAKVETLIYQG